MDFSALIAELRNIASSYNGRDIDSNVSTAMYCEMFRKILQKAESEVAAYDDQIVILWMTLSQLCQTYKTLTKCKERNDLYQHIFLLCAKVVLNIKWQQLADDDQSKENFRKTVEATHSQLVHAGFDRFGLLLNIMENPWTDPTITKIMSGDGEEESNSDTEEDENEMSDERKQELEERKKKKIQEREEEFAKYINSADPLILRLRVEMLMQENCEEWALNLCTCCLRQRRYQMDLEFKTMELLLLFKLGNMEKLQEVCETIECHHGIYIIEKLEKKESNQSLCVRLIQTFLVQDWIRPDRNCCTKKLLQMWIKYQSMEDKDREKFLDSVWAIAKISSSTDQVNQLVTGLVKKCGLHLLQLYTDLCVYAINFDKGCCEQQMIQGNMEGVKKQQWAISNTCIKLADLYCNCNPKLARIAALTAFSLNPSIQNFNVVRKTFVDKRKEKMQALKEDSTEEKGKETPQKTNKPRQSKYLQKVNPATIHEVERLLNMLRPYYLDPEMGFEKLQPVCQKFMDERGGGFSEPPKKPSRPPSKTNLSRQNSNTSCEDSAGLSRPKSATPKLKTAPITSQSPPSTASTALAKAPLFGNKPHSYRAMSQSDAVAKPKKVQSNVVNQRLVPAIQPQLAPQTKTSAVNSTSNISELLKATKTLPQYNPNGSPSASLSSYTSSSSASVPQRPGGVNVQQQSSDLLPRQSVNLPINAIVSRSEVIGDAGDKSIYHHLYKPLKTQEPTNLKTAKPPSNKLQVTNVNKFTSQSGSYNLGAQANFPSNEFNSLSRPVETMNFPMACAGGIDQRRPSAEELQSIVDWLQSGTEDAVSKQSSASFNPHAQQTPPPAHSQQMSFPARGQEGPNSQARLLPVSQKVDLNTLLTQPQVVANALKIQPKGKTAVQEAASQISQRLTDIRRNSDTAAGDAQLLLNLQKNSSKKSIRSQSTSHKVLPVPGNLGMEKNLPKNLTDKDLSLEEMKRRIADIVQKQRLLCESKPDQPAKRRRSASPKGKKQTGLASSTPPKGLNQTSSTPSKGLNPTPSTPTKDLDQTIIPSPLAAATVTSSCNPTAQPAADAIQKQQIQEWFNNRRQVQQQIEKVKQHPQTSSNLSKPQFILQQQAAPVQFVTAEQIENLHSNSAQRAAESPRVGQSLTEHPVTAQKPGDQYNQRLKFLPKSSQGMPNKFSLLEQKLVSDDNGMAAPSQDSNVLNSFSQPLNIHQLRMLQETAVEGFPQKGRLPTERQLPPHSSQGNPDGVAYGNFNAEGKPPSSDERTPTTLLSVLLEQSKYINSVAATTASSKPSHNESVASSQAITNVHPFSTVSNPVLASMVSTATSASPIRNSAQQTLSFLLPQTAHCGRQDVNSNSNSPSTSSNVDNRKTFKDSPKPSPVGFQLQYVGQIKTKEIPTVADSRADLFRGNKSGLGLNKSAPGMKLLTCDTDVMKEITKMIEGEKKQPNLSMDLPFQPKPQQLGETMNVNSRIPLNDESLNYSVQDKRELNNATIPSEKPTLLTNSHSHGKGDEMVKNHRQFLIDSLENGIKQSMEQIEVSAELLEKSPKKNWPQNLNIEQKALCLESFKDVSSIESAVLPQIDTKDAPVETAKKTERSAESQNSADETLEHGANNEGDSPLCSTAQSSVTTQLVESLANENVSASEMEKIPEKLPEQMVVETFVEEETSANPPDSEDIADHIPQSCVPEDEADRQTLAEAEDQVNSENGVSAEEQNEGKGVEPGKTDTDSIPDHVQSTLDTNNVQAPEAGLLLEKMEEVSEPVGEAVINENTPKPSENEEQDTVKETVQIDKLSIGIEKQLISDQEACIPVDSTEEKEQESMIKDSESVVMEDQNKDDGTSTEQGANLDSKEIPSEPKAKVPSEHEAQISSESVAAQSSNTENVEEEHAETKEKMNEIKSKESLCMEDIKLDNIDRSKVIHKLKSDMNNLLHQIEDLNGGHVSRTVGESLEDIKCHEPESKENTQILTLSNNIEKLEEELESERLKKGNKDAGQDINACQKIEASKSSQKEDKEPEKGVTETSEEVEESVMESESTGVKKEETQEKEDKKEELLSNISAVAGMEPKPTEETPAVQGEAKDVCVNVMEVKDDAKVKKEEGEKGRGKGVEEEKEEVEVVEEGNRKLDKFRKNQKRKKSDIPVNFGFDFNEESNAEEKNEDKKTSLEESFSKESEIIKVSPIEPKHKKLQGSAILKTRKKYRENLQGAQEMAEKIKEHIISGTKVVEITEKTSLTSVTEAKAEVKKIVATSNRVNEPDIDTHSVSSNSSSSSIPSMNQLSTSQPNTEKEKGVKEVSDKINKCLICGKEFRSVLSLKEHVKNMCKPTDFVRTKDYEFSSRFTCSKCGMTSSSAADMKRHMKKQHSLIDDKDIEDLLISNYRCEMCGETFKDKMSIYSHVSASCPQLESSRRKEFKMLVNDKRIAKNVSNRGNLNRGKLISAMVNQNPQHSRSSQGKISVCKNESQKQTKTAEINTKKVERDSKAEEVNKKQDMDAQPLQETVSSPSGTSSSESKKETSLQPEEGFVESQKSEELPVVNQRVTRSKLEKRSAGTGSGKNHTKDTQQQGIVEQSRRKSTEDQKKGKAQVEDACKKLSFERSPNRTVAKEEESKKDQVTGKNTGKSTEKKKVIKQASDEQSKTPAVKRQLRTRNSSLSPNTTANVEKKEDSSSSPPDQGKSLSTPSCTRLTRSKGTVENVDYNDLEKIEMNSRKAHTRHHSGSTDVSMLSECSEVEPQQQLKSPEQCDKKKSEEDSPELEGSSSVADDVESGRQTKRNSQRKRKEPSSGHPVSPEVPTRGKRLIKVKKYDQYEVPEFLTSQVNNSNKKRQSNSEPSSEKVVQNQASTRGAASKRERRKCSRCGKEFSGQTKLIKHIASVHLSPCKPSASSQCSYQCRYCKATYKSYTQFLNHIPGHSTQILEGMESTQIFPAAVHSKPVQVKDTEVNKSTEEEVSDSTVEEDSGKDEKAHSTQQSKNKSRNGKEQTENTIATRSRRSTVSTDNEQSDTVKQKSKLNLNSNTEETKQSALSEERTLTTRSRSRSGRGLDKKEDKLDEDKSSSSRQLRSRAESGGKGGGKGGDSSKKKSSSTVSQKVSPQVNVERPAQQKSEQKTRSNLKRKSDCAKSPGPVKKSKDDVSESAECESSEFELAGSDAEISFRKRLCRKRKVQVDFINTCDSDIEELEEDATDDKDYSPGDDHEEEDDEMEEDSVTEVKKIEVGSVEKVDDEDTKKNNQEKMSVAVVEDDEFEYVKSPTHETSFNEGVKNSADTKEKIILSRSSKDHSAYLNSYMSYIDNQNKRTRDLKERSEKVLQQNSKKKAVNKKPRPINNSMKETLKRETEAEKDNKAITAPVNQTPVNQTPTSFLDSFLEHCSKTDDNNQNSPAAVSVKEGETMEGEDQSNDRKTKSNQIQEDAGENNQNVEVKEGNESENLNTKVTEACDKTSINAFQDTFKSFVTAGSNKGDTSGDSPTLKESLSDVIEGLSDSERARRAGSEDSTHTVSSRCTDVSDASETAQAGPKSNKRMRHIYHNGKIWHVGAGNVTSMSVKLDAEGQAVTNSTTLPGPVTPGLTLATKQLIRVDRDKNSPHQDEGDNTYTYTTAEELKRDAQANANKWRKREKTPLSIRK